MKILLPFVAVGIVMLSVFTSNNNANAALKDPTGVAVDPSGNVFTSEARKNIIQKFTLESSLGNGKQKVLATENLVFQGVLLLILQVMCM